MHKPVQISVNSMKTNYLRIWQYETEIVSVRILDRFNYEEYWTLIIVHSI